jgi:hypothetical protein
LPFKTYLHRGANNGFMPIAEDVGMWQNHKERAKNLLFIMYVQCSRSCQSLLGDVWKQNWSKVVLGSYPDMKTGVFVDESLIYLTFVCYIQIDNKEKKLGLLRTWCKIFRSSSENSGSCQNVKRQKCFWSHMLKYKTDARLCGSLFKKWTTNLITAILLLSRHIPWCPLTLERHSIHVNMSA